MFLDLCKHRQAFELDLIQMNLNMVSSAFITPNPLPSSKAYHRELKSPRRPRFMASAATPSATPTPFMVQSADGISLSCLLDQAPNSKAPLYVLVHGFRDSKNGRFISKLASEMYVRGAQTCRFDCTGNGESGGQFAYANYHSEAEDLRAVVKHLRSEGHSVAGVAGHSKGGGVVLIYGQKYGDVDFIAALAPRYAMNTGIEERFGKELLEKVRTDGHAEVTNPKDGFKFILTKESLIERETLNMGDVAKGIPQNIRVVVVHGDEDAVISVKDADKFEKDIANCKKVIIEGADHGFHGYEKEVVNAFI